MIDDDLDRSASGRVARPGFERLVAWLRAGKVGAVLHFDAFRLARNGRNWHHLLELCGLVYGARFGRNRHFALEWKRVIGGGLRSQTEGRQASEVTLAVTVLNHMLELRRPEYGRLM